MVMYFGSKVKSNTKQENSIIIRRKHFKIRSKSTWRIKMKIMISFAIIIIVVACVLGACANTQAKEVKIQEEPESKSNIKDDKNIQEIDSDTDFYKELRDFNYILFNEIAGEENVVLSPISAYLALSMAGFGANGDTESEFHRVLGENMTEVSSNIMNCFSENSEDMTLSLANSAWLDTRFGVNQTWLDTIHSIPNAESFQIKLSDMDTMNKMNRWVEDKTNGLIEQMIEDPFDESTGLVLFNALYFKAEWSMPFESHMTNTEDFNLANGEQVKVDMMHKNRAELEYISNDFAEGVILPYSSVNQSNNTFAFIALKSKEGNTSELRNKITDEVISGLLDNSQLEMVNLKLPKFEVTLDKELNTFLQNMGLKTCFDVEKADFSRIGESENGDTLYIDLVRQKAKIIVDEAGTEAAAVTEVMMKYRSAMPVMEEPLEVFFDEPFLYMIMDIENEIPLFIGIMDNPAL